MQFRPGGRDTLGEGRLEEPRHPLRDPVVQVVAAIMLPALLLGAGISLLQL